MKIYSEKNLNNFVVFQSFRKVGFKTFNKASVLTCSPSYESTSFQKFKNAIKKT